MPIPVRWKWKIDRYRERLQAMFAPGEKEQRKPQLCPSCGKLVGSETHPCAQGFFPALARLRHARAAVYAGVRAGHRDAAAGCGRGALVDLAVAGLGAAVSSHRDSHRAAVRILAGGDCFVFRGPCAGAVYAAALPGRKEGVGKF